MLVSIIHKMSIPLMELNYRLYSWFKVEEEKDLGVIVSANMKWESQCTEAVKKANKMICLIKRTFQYKSKATIMSLIRVWLDLT